MLMQKRILVMASAAMLFLAAPVATQAMTMEMSMGIAEQVEPEHQVVISMDANVVSVNGANGMVLEVVSLTGRHVASYKIESPAMRLDLNLSKGCYILKVGKVVRKVTLR
jgi:hypothetical protein